MRLDSMTGWIAISLFGLASSANAAVLDSGDRAAIEAAAQQALEHAPLGEPTRWENPRTGSRGTFTPISTYESAEGQVCREYVVSGTVRGQPEQIRGMACRGPEGGWQESVATRASNPRPRDLPGAVTNPWDWWWVVPAISISAVYCDDGFCIGGRSGPRAWYYPFARRYRFPNYYAYPHSYRHPWRHHRHPRRHYGHKRGHHKRRHR